MRQKAAVKDRGDATGKPDYQVTRDESSSRSQSARALFFPTLLFIREVSARPPPFHVPAPSILPSAASSFIHLARLRASFSFAKPSDAR